MGSGKRLRVDGFDGYVSYRGDWIDSVRCKNRFEADNLSMELEIKDAEVFNSEGIRILSKGLIET